MTADAGAAQKKTVTDTVYVKPTPQPRVIHITKPTAHPHRQQVVTVVRSAHRGGDDGSERGGEGRDD